MNLPSETLQTREEIKICRCCLNKEGTRDISIEFNDYKENEIYEEMLNNVFNIQPPKILKVKQYICENCIMKLREASSFKQMVLKNDDMYLKCLQNLLQSDTMEVTQENIKEEFVDNDICDNEILTESIEEEVTQIDEKTKTGTKVKHKQNEHQINKTNTERRGAGPTLRENSLKLLNNSTLTIFQYNKSAYTCFCCKKPFHDFNLLRKHTECHNIGDIEKRIISQHNQLVKVELSDLNCKICCKELKDLDGLITHLGQHDIVINEHLLIPFKIENELHCQICSKAFSLFRLLNIHMNKHYQNYVCYVCGAGFSSLVFLNLHKSRIHRPIECQKCLLSFKSKLDKKSHDLEQHGVKIERKRRFPCAFCSERFYQEDLKVKHLVQFHGVEKPEFTCQFCSKCFITKSLLNNHVKVVHMKERSHQCGVCSKVFYTKSDVVRHSVTHTGEKNFVCSICSNVFATKDSLRRHVKRSHVGN